MTAALFALLLAGSDGGVAATPPADAGATEVVRSGVTRVRIQPGTAKPGDADYGLLYTSGSDHGFSNGGGSNANNPAQTQRLDSIMTAILRIDPRSPSVTGGVKGLGDYTIPAANKFAADGVKFVIGHFNSGVTIPASDIYAENGMMVVSPAATNPQLTERGLWNTFRTCGRATFHSARFLMLPPPAP